MKRRDSSLEKTICVAATNRKSQSNESWLGLTNSTVPVRHDRPLHNQSWLPPQAKRSSIVSDSGLTLRAQSRREARFNGVMVFETRRMSNLSFIPGNSFCQQGQQDGAMKEATLPPESSRLTSESDTTTSRVNLFEQKVWPRKSPKIRYTRAVFCIYVQNKAYQQYD